MDVEQVSQLSQDAFEARFAHVFEKSPWVARAAWASRPWGSVDELHAAMVAAMDAAPREQRLALLRSHPDLSAKPGRMAELTAESSAEQAAAGLDEVDAGRARLLTTLNRAYADRFGFPFIVCAREHTPDSILETAARRLTQSQEVEERTALDEVAKIARLRLADTVVAA